MSSTVLYALHGSVAVIRMNAPPVNGLGLELRRSVADCLSRGLSSADVAAIVLIGSERAFSGGADVREFGTSLVMQEPSLRTVTALVEDATKPIIAAVGGACMGGGFELALACHFRVAAHDAMIALPEVKLGIMPGAGGTQRLPRAAGLEIALDMITTGKTVRASELRGSGVFDEIVNGDLPGQAIAFAERLLADRRPLKRLRDGKVDHPRAAAVLTAAESRLKQTSPRQPAPLTCVQAVALTLSTSFDEGLRLESQLCDRLIATPESKALRHVFAAERAASKVPGASAEIPARTVRQVGIIGAGPIGDGLAKSCLDAGLAVVRSEPRRAEIAGCDLIIEAWPRTVPAKEKIFEDIASQARQDAILASSDPYTDLNGIAAAARRPQDVVGLHFVNPAQATRVVEIATGRSTGADVLAACVAFAKRLNRVPVVCTARAGLIGERMLSRYSTVAWSLVTHGSPAWQIERALLEFGMAVSPFRAGESPGPVLAAPPRKGKIEGRLLDDPDIVARCVYALVNEGAVILEEGVAARSSDVDILSIHACGFPAHRGGVLYYANEVGLERVAAAVKSFGEDADPEEPYWRIAPLLAQLAAARKRFG